ncbi:MAG: DUF58 domain-containing protein [Caldilineaceae bacterium]|nr:DUF58 domain-containing protein [Caldilineaceae bacterium]
MQLTTRAWVLLLLTALPLAAIAQATFWALIALGWLIVVAALLLADWRLTPSQTAWQVSRRHDERLSLAAHNPIELIVELRRGLTPLQLWVRDEIPAAFQVATDEQVLTAHLTPRIPHTLTYQVYPPRRGDYGFGNLHLRWASVLGLLYKQATLPAAAAVKVYPNLVDVKKYDLLLRQNRLWELGLRSARILGSGTEFERLRDYLPDDEYRRIDWKATARRGKPISVEYETERSQHIMVLLDVGRMMRSPVGDVAKLDYAINAALLLAYVATQKGDKVGCLAFADAVQLWVAPRSGKQQFQRLLEQLYRLEGAAIEPDYAQAFSYFAAKQHKRSLVLLFTDLTGSLTTDLLLAQMGRIRRQHLPLLVTMRDPTVQHLADQGVVDETTLYQRTVAEQLLQARQLTIDRLTQHGILTVDVPADQLSLAVVNRYLDLKERNRI